jgi:amino acid transporter
LDIVIDAMLLTRILVQFIGQIVAVALLRRRAPELPRPYRIWLYPVPCLIALVGWIYVFVTVKSVLLLAAAIGAPLAGVLFFLGWSRLTRRWPFETGRDARP